MTVDTDDNALFEAELAGGIRDDWLHLIILPTEHCNFRCIYCYEDFSIGRMRPPVIPGLPLLVEPRVQELSPHSSSTYAGEPQLARAVVEDISAHICALQERYPGLGYVGDMTTNAYLLDVPTLA